MMNQIKTGVLLASLGGLLLLIGYLIGGFTSLGPGIGLTIAFAIAMIINFGTYFWSDKIVLAMYRAKPIKEKDNPKLFRMVKEICELADMPMPKVYIIPSNSPNAFATGRNPKNAAVAFTKSIIDLLDEKELRGVAAHEISHIKNRDILVATIAATIATMISYIASMAQFAAIFGGGRDNEGGHNILSMIVLAILAPLIATIIQLAISRSREYLADSTGAKIISDPKSLASALEKIHHGIRKNPMEFGNEATASLFISSPFSSKSFFKLFDTHPPMEERVRKLRNM